MHIRTQQIICETVLLEKINFSLLNLIKSAGWYHSYYVCYIVIMAMQFIAVKLMQYIVDNIGHRAYLDHLSGHIH